MTDNIKVKQPPNSKAQTKNNKQAKKDRLADALRDNLRRRKTISTEKNKDALS